MINFAYERAENIVGKGENIGKQHLPFDTHCLPKPFLSGFILKCWFVWEKVCFDNKYEWSEKMKVVLRLGVFALKFVTFVYILGKHHILCNIVQGHASQS